MDGSERTVMIVRTYVKKITNAERESKSSGQASMTDPNRKRKVIY